MLICTRKEQNNYPSMHILRKSDIKHRVILTFHYPRTFRNHNRQVSLYHEYKYLIVNTCILFVDPPSLPTLACIRGWVLRVAGGSWTVGSSRPYARISSARSSGGRASKHEGSTLKTTEHKNE